MDHGKDSAVAIKKLLQKNFYGNKTKDTPSHSCLMPVEIPLNQLFILGPFIFKTTVNFCKINVSQQ